MSSSPFHVVRLRAAVKNPQCCVGLHPGGWRVDLARRAMWGLALVVWAVACSSPASTSTSGEADIAETTLDIKTSGKDVVKDAAPDLAVTPDVPAAETTPDVSVDVPPDAPDAPDTSDVADTASPALAHLCEPCASAATCNVGGGSGNLCVGTPATGRFCGVACVAGEVDSCPTGYACTDVPDPAGGAPVAQCVPTTGACTCSAAAIAAGASTPCATTSGAGTCTGVRKCTASGLTACDAPTPTTETCNGQDDNCDGATDEGLCDDANPCTDPVCGADGSCAQDPLSGIACDDGNPCTEADLCVAGVCKGKKAKCDDGNPCTTDGCGLGGCTHTNSVDPCGDDGNLCTGDYCDGGTCTHVGIADGTTCTDDGNVCTENVCTGGVCTANNSVDGGACLDDQNPCTLDACLAGACAHVPVPADVTCADDGNLCTDDVCQSGQCSHPPILPTDVTCATDNNECTTDVCAAGLCGHPAVTGGTPCTDDGQACTNDVCQSGACQHPPKAIGDTCKDDGNACTSDTCQGGTCVHLATLVGQGCADDGDPCTIDTCTKQGGCGHALDPNKCKIGGVCYDAGQGSPGDPCKQCAPATSQSQFSPVNNVPCEDGNLCTTGEKCSGGSCSGGVPKDCTGLNNTCGTFACDKDTGLCLGTPKNGPCDDGDVCTASDHCQGGQCVGTEPDCSAYNGVCTIGKCQGGVCKQLPLSGPCDDGDPCTEGDACSLNKCVGQTKDCSALNSVCGTGVCAQGVCTAAPKGGSTACDDNNGCTFNDQCVSGLCVGVLADCTTFDSVCLQGVCDPTSGGCKIVNRPEVTPCSDGDPCTQNDHCAAGSCTGTSLTCPAAKSVCEASYCSGGKCIVVATNDSGPCDDQSTCTNYDICGGGVCKGKDILDQYEVNNSGTGADLGVKSDCDGPSGLNASISPAQDIDFFHYKAKDDNFCNIYPDVTIQGLAADYDLCVWFACSDGSSGSSVVGCDAGNYASGGPNGWSGCCSTNSGTTPEHVRHNDTCSFLGLGDDSGTVVVQVFPKNATVGKMCGGYNMTWQSK